MPSEDSSRRLRRVESLRLGIQPVQTGKNVGDSVRAGCGDKPHVQFGRGGLVFLSNQDLAFYLTSSESRPTREARRAGHRGKPSRCLGYSKREVSKLESAKTGRILTGNGSNTGERRARKPACGVRRRAGGKGRCESYLVCGLSYFVLGLTGPKSEAEDIKQQLSTFLQEELQLTLSPEKTLITHARNEAAKFLGYEITTLQADTKQSITRGGVKRRSINGTIGLRVPRTTLLEKCKRYQRQGKPCHRAELLNESDYTILATYQLEYRGIVNYYRLAYNLHTLRRLKWVMETSLTKTLAAKHQISVKAVYRKYHANLPVEGRMYKGLHVAVTREGKKPLIATWGGIPLTWDNNATIQDRPHQLPWNNRTELEKRLLAQTCEVCEATSMTDKLEVHHIRALKDLGKYDGREKPEWVKIMAARRRKTLVLCQVCHRELHAGRPFRKKVSRSRTEADR